MRKHQQRLFQPQQKTYPILEIVACADIDLDRAKAKAAEHNVPKAYTPEQLLADPEIEIVINLTIPAAHHAVSKAVIEIRQTCSCRKAALYYP